VILYLTLILLEKSFKTTFKFCLAAFRMNHSKCSSVRHDLVLDLTFFGEINSRSSMVTQYYK